MNIKRDAYLFGLQAEELILVTYQNLGFSFVSHRKKYKFIGEIDLIVQKDNLLVFVEVKARKKTNYNFPLIHNRQIQRVSDAAALFVQENPKFQQYIQRLDLAYLQENNLVNIVENIIL